MRPEATLPSALRAELRRLLRAWDAGEDPWRERPVALRLEEGAGALTEAFAGRRVLVTGAAGSLGGALLPALAARRPAALIALDKDEQGLFALGEAWRPAWGAPPRRALCDLRVGFRLRTVLREARPHLVIHAAAHKHAPLLQGQAAEAVANNTFAAADLWDAAAAHGAERLVLISTDKATRPANWLGASKRAAELMAQERAARGAPGVILRLANVLGSRGSVAEIWWRCARRGQPLPLTDPTMTRWFLGAAVAVAATLRAAAGAGEAGEVLVPTRVARVRLDALAREFAAAAGPRVAATRAPTGRRAGERRHEQLLDPEEARRARPIAEGELLAVPPRELKGSEIAAALAALRRDLQAGAGSARLAEDLRELFRRAKLAAR